MTNVTRKGIFNKTWSLTCQMRVLIIHTIPIIGRYLQNMTITSQTADYVVANRFVSVFFNNFYAFLIFSYPMTLWSRIPLHWYCWDGLKATTRKRGGRLMQMLSVAVADVISLREALVTYHVRESETPSRRAPFAAIAVSKYNNFSNHTPRKTCSNDMQLCCTHQSYSFFSTITSTRFDFSLTWIWSVLFHCAIA